MTLKEEMKKTLGLIEELNPESEYLTDDPDIEAKIYAVFNQVMFELARIKKIPRYVEIEVNEGDLITFETLERACGSTVYQLSNISGISYELKAQGTVIKALEYILDVVFPALENDGLTIPYYDKEELFNEAREIAEKNKNIAKIINIKFFFIVKHLLCFNYKIKIIVNNYQK